MREAKKKSVAHFLFCSGCCCCSLTSSIFLNSYLFYINMWIDHQDLCEVIHRCWITWKQSQCSFWELQYSHRPLETLYSLSLESDKVVDALQSHPTFTEKNPVQDHTKNKILLPLKMTPTPILIPFRIPIPLPFLWSAPLRKRNKREKKRKCILLSYWSLLPPFFLWTLTISCNIE